jgi:hypothetical protein
MALEHIITNAEKQVRKAEDSRRQDGYGYDLTQVVRENLMWLSNMPFAEAQRVAEKISDQVYYSNWITVALPDGRWNTFKR